MQADQPIAKEHPSSERDGTRYADQVLAVTEAWLSEPTRNKASQPQPVAATDHVDPAALDGVLTGSRTAGSS